MPGTYSYEFNWGKNNVMASGVFQVELTRETINQTKEYYKKLLAKRIELTKFPDTYGCDDAKSRIVNVADLNKYGTLLRISLAGTGNIMKPWPNDHEIDWNTAQGYAAIETPQGTVEVIHLEFRKRPTARVWKWWSIGSTSTHYDLLYQGADGIGVKAEKGKFGYVMLKENVQKCASWDLPRR